jgi:hypothetical protein
MSQTKAQLVSGTTAQDLTVDNINTTSINSGQPSGRKNIIINGAMNIAQRGTSSTSTAYQTVDRFRMITSGVDEAPTQAQADVASGTTPYTLGFRKSFKITNGDQTSVGAADFIKIQYRLEAQDIANSGWNYVSSSSYITLSFWVKSSIAQNFYGYLETSDGSTYLYPFETGSLTADTWTKVTKTISGNSNLVFNNDNGQGLQIEIQPFMGTDSTASGVSLNQWNAYAAASRTPDQTSTWYDANDATFELTGVQLEVGSTASDFEHRSYADEFLRCCRYYYFTNAQYFFQARGNNSDGLVGFVDTQVPLRNTPSITMTGGLRHWGIDSNSSSTTQPTIPSFRANQKGVRINQTGHSGVNDDCVMTVQTDGSDGQGLAFDAEL